MSLNAINILKFLEKVDNRPIPLLIKLTKNLPLTPEDLNVKGHLNLSNTPITSLPDNLQVGGDLDLSRTPITSLPDNLKVSGDFYLGLTKITSLPDNLKVSGDFYLGLTPLSKQYTKEQIRQMIEDKGGYVKGTIYLH
jgi:hypothetical protein